jgi:hypothetical protein
LVVLPAWSCPATGKREPQRSDYVNRINQQNAADEMNQMREIERRMNEDARRWWAPDW